MREAEANNEVKDEEKHADVRIAEDIQNMKKTKADKKRKQAQDQAQAIARRRSRRTIPKYDSEDCGHRSRRRRPNKSYSNLTTQVSLDRNMSRTRKTEQKERKNEKNARRKSNRNRAREQGSRKHELSWRKRLQKIYENGYTCHQEKDHAICIATTCVENTTRERRRHGGESRHAQGEAKEFQLHTS